MKIWIYINGAQEGPYTLEELLDKPVTEDTKIWFEGMPKWCPAGTVEELRPLFTGEGLKEAATADSEEPATAAEEETIAVGETVDADGTLEVAVEETPRSRYAPGQRSYTPRQKPSEPCPPTYLGWTIFLTVCCCSPVSLASLISSIFVSNYYNNGRMDRARKASDVTAWLIMVAIALGFLPVMLMGLFMGE